jgi:hypothetical protein
MHFNQPLPLTPKPACESLISRRGFLRGAGIALAIPWMESLVAPWRRPALAAGAAAATASPPRRMAVLYVPNGMHMPAWQPEEEGPLDVLPPTLKPLESVKSECMVLSGLALDGGRAHRDGPGDHARAMASFLTGAHPYKTHGKDICAGVSVDQEAAATAAFKTRFASLELGCDDSAQAGDCDSGYSCAYSSNISWRTPNSPLTKETDPRAVFDRLFGPGGAAGHSGAIHRQQERSLLDFVADDARDLQARLSGSDRRKLDEYLYAVRDVERRVAAGRPLAGRGPADAPRVPKGFVRPEGRPRGFARHVRLLMDMALLAFQTDSTRIITLVFANEGSNRSYPEIDVASGHHELSHHSGDKMKQQAIAKINLFHAGNLAYFLERMRSAGEGGRNLLDHSMVLYGSGLGDGDRHNHDDLPILLAGRGGGTLKPGRHVRYPFNTPLTNLYVGMLRRMGSPSDKFADSRGELNDLG